MTCSPQGAPRPTDTVRTRQSFFSRLLRRQTSPRPGRRRAAAAVEFAFVAPVVVLLVFGMIEFGRVVMAGQIMTNAAREGGRRAVLPSASTNDVKTTITDYLTASGISGATVTTSPTDVSSAAVGSSVTVTVSVPCNNVSWLPVAPFTGGKTMTSTVVMRKEASNY